jgi:hypothetical protein
MKSLCMDAPTIHVEPGVELEHVYESFRCVEFRGHKLDPRHRYQEDELLHMDSDGDEIVSSKEIRIGNRATIAIQVLEDATPADALRILRKMIAAIEKTGLVRGAWTDYTNHPAIAHVDAHVDALRKREEPAASLTNLSESLNAAEPNSEDEEAIPETTILERKFDEFKEKTEEPVKVTLQVWDPVEGCSDDGIDLTEKEFAAVLATVRKMREEKEVLMDEAVAAFERAAAA